MLLWQGYFVIQVCISGTFLQQDASNILTAKLHPANLDCTGVVSAAKNALS